VKKKSVILPWLFIIPALVAYGLFKYFPILQAAFLSLRSSSALGTGNFVGFANYLRAFSDELFRRAWFNTFYFVVLNLLINFIPPIVLAICISEVRKGQSFFRTAFFIPSLTPAIVTMVLWKWIYNPDYGLLNYLLGLFKLPKQLWLNDPKLAMLCLVLPGLWGAGYNAVIYLAALTGIPQELYEAAAIDGATVWQRITKITIPRLRPVIVTMFILAVMGSFQVFNQPFVMTGGGPMNATNVVSLQIYNQAFEFMEFNYAVAQAMILFAVLFVLTWLQLRFVKADVD
jgi:multiple sugar transport system permease protein